MFDWMLKLYLLISLELNILESTFVFRLTKSDFRKPENIGSYEMLTMNEMAETILSLENKKLPIHHITGPEGVRARNSDTVIKEKDAKDSFEEAGEPTYDTYNDEECAQVCFVQEVEQKYLLIFLF
jgi:hypothetical protein